MKHTIKLETLGHMGHVREYTPREVSALLSVLDDHRIGEQISLRV